MKNKTSKSSKMRLFSSEAIPSTVRATHTRLLQRKINMQESPKMESRMVAERPGTFTLSEGPAPLPGNRVESYSVPELRLSSCTSSTSQHVRPDDPVIENGHDSSRSPGSTIGLSTTQLNSTRLSGSGAESLVTLTGMCFMSITTL